MAALGAIRRLERAAFGPKRVRRTFYVLLTDGEALSFAIMPAKKTRFRLVAFSSTLRVTHVGARTVDLNKRWSSQGSAILGRIYLDTAHGTTAGTGVYWPHAPTAATTAGVVGSDAEWFYGEVDDLLSVVVGAATTGTCDNWLEIEEEDAEHWERHASGQESMPVEAT